MAEFNKENMGSLLNYQSLYNLKIVSNDLITQKIEYTQFRYPKTKKKRIRKKWAKRPQNFKNIVFYRAIVIGDTIYMHSKFYNEYLQHLKPRK